MKKWKQILSAALAIVIMAGFFMAGSGIKAQAATSKGIFKQGRYQGKNVDLIIYDLTDVGKKDFPAIYFKGKSYKKPAYQCITIVDDYGVAMGFETEYCNKKGKKSMIAWAGGSGVGGGQTCWAIVTKKSKNKILLKVYWQDNEDALRYGTKPECIEKATLKYIGEP